MIRVAIADDQHLIRQALRALIERESDIQVVAEAANGQEAVEITRRLKPDVLVMDLNMPALDGIEATRQIRELCLPTRVMILSMYSDAALVKKAMRGGARGYVLKGSLVAELLAAIREIHCAGLYLSRDLPSDVRAEPGSPLDQPADLERLTVRERQVFRLVAEGYTNLEISRRLDISVKTVEKHRASLMDKINVHDTASLVRKAIELNLIFIER